MRNHYITRIYITLFSLLFILNSCSNLRIEKRQHQFGYHVHWTKKYKKSNDHSNKNLIQIKDISDFVDTSEILNITTKEFKIEENKASTSLSEVPIEKFSYQKQFNKKNLNRKRQHKQIRKEVFQLHTSSTKLNTKKDSDHLSFFYFLGLILPLPFLFKSKTYKVSKWASENKHKSISLLILSKVLLASLSFALGLLIGGAFSSFFFIIPLIIIVVVYIINALNKEKGYLHRKLSTYGLSLGSIGLFFSLAQTYPGNELVLHPLLAFFLTILTIAALIGLLYLIAIATCSLSCSGYEVLAAILFFGGIFLSVFGAIALLLYINRRYYSPPVKDRLPKIALIILIVMASFVLLGLLGGLLFG